MTISVVLPSYNCARYLPEALESVFAQTYREVEVIVVNDGSTDNTDEVVRPYLDRIRYIKQPNKGLSAARNAGFKASTGEFICFLDADDLLMPDKFERQLEVFEREADLGVVISGYVRVAEDGFTELATVRKYWNRDALDHLLNHEVFPPHAALIRREVLENSGLFPEGIDTQESQEDLQLWLDLALNGVAFSSIPEPTCKYRHREGSISSNAMKHFDGARRVVQWLERDPRTHGMRDRIARFAAIVEAGRLARAIAGGLAREAADAFEAGFRRCPDYWYLPSSWSKIHSIAFGYHSNGRDGLDTFEKQLILDWIPRVVSDERRASQMQGVAYCALTDKAYAAGEKQTARYAAVRALKRLALTNREVMKSLVRGALGRNFFPNGAA